MRADPQLPDADPERSVAAIDLGTQTALLVIVRAEPDGTLEVVEDHAFAAKLGAGLGRGPGADGRLAASARERTRDVLATFARRIALHGIPSERVHAVGTAVLRRAVDASDFVREVHAACGLAIDVVGGADEARYSWLGATAFPRPRRNAPAPACDALIDVGGGSAEIVGPMGAFVGSLDIGAAWLTERFASDPRTGEYAPGAFARLEAEVAAAAAALPRARARQAVLVGGGAVNLGSLVRAAPAFDHRLAEGVAVDAERVAGLARDLARASHAERLDLPIEAERAAALPAGFAVMAALLRHLGDPAATVTTRGLRHGVALELARRCFGLAGTPS